MSTFKPKVVKQKKEHVCQVCNELMPVGTIVKSVAGKVDGKFVSWYEHDDATVCDGNLAKKAN